MDRESPCVAGKHRGARWPGQPVCIAGLFLSTLRRVPEPKRGQTTFDPDRPWWAHLCSLCHFQSTDSVRSEEHTSELQSRPHLVCRLLLEKKNNNNSLSNDT